MADIPLALFPAEDAEPERISREPDPFICGVEKMHRVKEIIQQVADTDVTVLILGESRVGKEVADR